MKRDIYRKIQVAGIFFLLNLCFYGIFCVQHFAADTYLTETYGWYEIGDLYWENGRWLMTLLCAVCDIFSIGFAAEKTISWILAMIFLPLAEMVLYEILEKKIGHGDKPDFKWILIVLSSFMMISNLFVLEYFIFAEYTGPICVGIFFNVLEVRWVLKFLETGKWKDFFLGVFFGIVGIMGHQGAFGLIAVLLILLAEHTFLNVKTFFKNTVVIGSAYLIPAVVNVIQTKICGSPRVAGELKLIESLKAAVYQSCGLLITTANFMPHFLYLSLCGAAGIVVLVIIIKKKDIRKILHVFYVCVVFTMAVLAPFLMTESAYISVVPRTVYIMGAGLPIIMILLLLAGELPQKILKAAVAYSAVFLGIQYFNVCQMETSHYVANGIDYYECNYIEYQVYLYEQETGNHVTKIKIYVDDSPLGIYYNLTGYGAINERVLSNDWAAPNAYMVFTGRDLTVEEADSAIYEKYFQGKNWDFFSQEQIVLVGDTLHLCLY